MTPAEIDAIWDNVRRLRREYQMETQRYEAAVNRWWLDRLGLECGKTVVVTGAGDEFLFRGFAQDMGLMRPSQNMHLKTWKPAINASPKARYGSAEWDEFPTELSNEDKWEVKA